MKSLILGLILIFGANSNAAGGDSAATTVKVWLQQMVGGHRNVDFLGRLPDGSECLFSLSSKGSGIFFVTVYKADTPDSAENDFLGVSTSESSIQIDNNYFDLRTEGSWGNDSKFNHLRIETNAQGGAVKVTGTSDLRSLECTLLQLSPSA